MACFVAVCQAFRTPGGERGGSHPHGVFPTPFTPVAVFGALWRPLADFDAPGIYPPSFQQQEIATHGLRSSGRPLGDDRPPQAQGEKI